MCGLFGIINRAGEALDLDKSMHLLKLLNHRGPDGLGYYSEDDVFIGHTRLSIIDVEGGKQPLYSEDGRYVLVGNGEIYNHKKIREDLKSKGHIFSTQSDTEVLVHLFEDERENFLNKLNGMFAVAIYDQESRSLFLARDRVGIKPLYYYHDKDRFIFSSEIKVIARSGFVPLNIDESVLYQYLTVHHSIPPDTLIKGIKSIYPGHYLYVKDGELKQQQYWDIESNSDKESPTFREACDNIESLLCDSVDKRLMSDVPLGLFLSGGIDSSLIAVLMHKIVGKGIKTFSIGFKEKEFSELPYSRRVSELIHSDHKEIIVTAKEIIDNIEPVIWYRETPISELSDIPIYLLSRSAAEDVKVVLTGEGGDEVFAGYNKYYFEKYGNVSFILGNRYIKFVAKTRAAKRLIPQRMLNAANLYSEKDKYRRYYQWFGYFRNDELQDMLRNDALGLIQSRNIFKEIAAGKKFRTRLDEMQYLDLKAWLPDNLLLRGDRMSMAAGLEIRVPFLDHRLVEESYRIPNSFKLKGHTGKYILKNIAEKYLPGDIIYRNKIGFNVPISKWFRNELKDYLISYLTRINSLSLCYFDSDKLKRMIHDHINGRYDYHKKLWILLNLELWKDQFIDEIDRKR